MSKAIMIQGTGSNVGKSMIVAGLCRCFHRRGVSVAPFKPQNMSNNAAVTCDLGEIGRAQALQAKAAGRQPHSDMNPVLLKPESESGAQVILQGKRLRTIRAKEYGRMKSLLMPAVLDSFNRLSRSADLVIVEGAGSPAEVNLRAGDIANMGFAVAANLPVVLVGDIDRGGVIAQMVGTHAVLDDADRQLISGFIVNKFRGDPDLFTSGMQAIVNYTDWAPLGLCPFFADAWRLPAEDIMEVSSRGSGKLKIAVLKLGRMANFDDLDPLSAEPDVTVTIVDPGRPLPGDAQLVIIPGSKSTIADLKMIRDQGWDIDLAGHIRRGGHVLGLCGGYQMLGNSIRDPGGIEGPASVVPALGYLDVDTTITEEKSLRDVTAICGGLPVSGYEIHMGSTTGPDRARGWLTVGGAAEGASSVCGRIRGTYIHGLFTNDSFRESFLSRLGATSEIAFKAEVECTLDRLADHLENHLDLDQLLSLAGEI